MQSTCMRENQFFSKLKLKKSLFLINVLLPLFLRTFSHSLCFSSSTELREKLNNVAFSLFFTHQRENSFMQSIFSSRTSKHPSRNPNNLNHFRPNQVTFGSKSLKAIGPQIWNCLPNEIKSADNLNSFKRMIKQWDGPSCKCNACKYNHTL